MGPNVSHRGTSGLRRSIAVSRPTTSNRRRRVGGRIYRRRDFTRRDSGSLLVENTAAVDIDENKSVEHCARVVEFAVLIVTGVNDYVALPEHHLGGIGIVPVDVWTNDEGVIGTDGEHGNQCDCKGDKCCTAASAALGLLCVLTVRHCD